MIFGMSATVARRFLFDQLYSKKIILILEIYNTIVFNQVNFQLIVLASRGRRNRLRGYVRNRGTGRLRIFFT